MKMLINATRAEQLRVAVVEGTTLHEYQVQIDESGLTRGNIYRGVVANVQPSLNAAFIDIGEERHGFLPVADVLESAYQVKPPKNVRRPGIDQVLKKGQPILVQVTKDGVGQKGAALTTNVALAGRYLVLTPFDSVRGISRKAEDDKDRKTIKSRLKKLSLPDDHGIIVRTNGIDQNQATLSRDLNALLRLWRKVQTESERGRGPRLLYSDQDLVVQALRDYLDPEIEQVVVDSDEVFEKAEDYMKAFMPRTKTRLVRYKDSLPLFSRYRLETQIDKIYERTAALPSGGSIVIDLTEALTAIDVNSGRATRNANHEDSIFKINCEAAEEVARQLRLRDIGGLVVVDFIDMRLRKHQARLERIMRDAMKPDKARYSVGRISPNGLMEINRQRIKQSLRLRTHRPCPTCNGQATIPTPEFSALRLLSRIEGRAASGRVKHVTVGLHPEMADMLQNHFRRELMGLESDHDVEVEIIAASNLRRTEERLDWVERSEDEAKALEKAQQKKTPAFSSSDLSAESRHRDPAPRRNGDDRKPKQDSRSRDEESPRKARPAGSPADESGDEPRSTSRRRRSRRRRSADDQPVTQAATQPVTKTAARATEGSRPQAGDDEESTSTSRRRRSRGGRGGRSRRGGRDGDEAASQEQAASTASKPERAERVARAETDDAAGDDAGTTRCRRSRSRGRGRGREGAAADAGRPDAKAPSKAEPATPKTERVRTVSADQDVADKDVSADGDKPAVRRRRRSRRGGAEGAAEAQPVESKQAEAKPVETKPSERKPTARPTKASKPQDAQPNGDEAAAAPKARRTRSRSSGRRASSDAAPKSEATQAEAPKAPARAAAKTEAPKSGEAAGDSETTRRRRSRSRSRTRGADASETGATDAPKSAPRSTDAPKATAQEARQKRGGRGADARGTDTHGTDAHGADAPSDNGDRPPRPQTAEKPAPPVGVLAGHGVDPQPKAKKRWSWWGGSANPAPDPNEGGGDS